MFHTNLHKLCIYYNFVKFKDNLLILVEYYLGNNLYSFDGVGGGIVSLATAFQCVQGNNPRSISFMIQTTHTSTGVILTTGSNAPSQTFTVSFGYNSMPVIGVLSYANDYYPTSGKAINDGLWHSVLVTYDGTTLSIYVDGRLDNTATSWNSYTYYTISTTLNTNGNSFNFLGQWVDGNNRWAGKLKNVEFYDICMTNTSSVLPLTFSPTAAPTPGRLLYNSGLIFI